MAGFWKKRPGHSRKVNKNQPGGEQGNGISDAGNSQASTWRAMWGSDMMFDFLWKGTASHPLGAVCQSADWLSLPHVHVLAFFFLIASFSLLPCFLFLIANVPHPESRSTSLIFPWSTKLSSIMKKTYNRSRQFLQFIVLDFALLTECLMEQCKRRNYLFWLMISEVPDNSPWLR
jgi:hypothetical protein